MKKKLISMSLLAVVFLFSGCGNNAKKVTNDAPISRSNFYLGTYCKVTIYDKSDESILDKAFNRIEEFDKMLSINKENTEVDNINDKSGIEKVKVNDDIFKLIDKSLNYSKLTGGAFDTSIGPIVKLWNIGLDSARVPSKEEVTKALPLVGYKNVELNANEKTVYLKEKGMALDFGAIAKGYIADEVVEVLKDNGVKKAIVDLGGNIYALGSNKEDKPWKIGIQDPDLERNNIIGYMYSSNKSVVTSGIYERFFEKDGVKYHHILSPFNGYPFNNEIMGVTIVSDLSIDGDALSTSTFSLGLNEGIKFINSIPNVDAIFITKDHKIYLTDGIRNNFSLTNEKYKLAN